MWLNITRSPVLSCVSLLRTQDNMRDFCDVISNRDKWCEINLHGCIKTEKPTDKRETDRVCQYRATLNAIPI